MAIIVDVAEKKKDRRSAKEAVEQGGGLAGDKGYC